MDRGRPSRALIAVALALVLGGPSASDGIPIREARWLAPDRLFAALSREPTECLAWPVNNRERRSVAIGRIAFRAPLLLGGQAARAGMSCAACHRNGRGNPDFLFPALSGLPGTADVTSSLMSSKRGDRIVNPKPIPDLGGPKSTLKISQARDGTLERFIHGLVVEEFDGPEPPPEVLSGLADYVRATRSEACRDTDRRIRLAERLDEVEQAVSIARDSVGGARRLMLAAARSSLGAIDERFQMPGLDAERSMLREADRKLEAIRAGSADFADWTASWPAIKYALLRAEPRTLYAERHLRRLTETGGLDAR